MSPERTAKRQPPETAEARSDDGGGLLIPAVVFTVGTVIGWVAYVFSALVVLNYLVRLDTIVTVIPGLSPTANLWVASGVLVVLWVVMLVRPMTVLAGWVGMGILVAVAATYSLGWTQTIVMVEGLTVGFVALALFVKVLVDIPKELLFLLALDKRRR
jgi:hypothetical protein